MRYYQKNGRMGIALRYVHSLYGLHVKNRQFTEAGFALKLHYDALDWSKDMLEPFKEYPAQTQRERKEQLCHKIIEHFDQGCTWENAIAPAKDLARHFEEGSFDYVKLSKLHSRIGDLYNKMATAFRQEPQYFKVGYYGLGHPIEFRNKAFIYRGNKTDHVQIFHDKIRGQFPTADFLVKNDDPTDEIKNKKDGAVIMICKVNSVPDETKAFKRFGDKYSKLNTSDNDAHKKLKAFTDGNEVTQFTYDRAFRKGPKVPGNEFKTMWVASYTLTCLTPMPCELARGEVIEETCKEMSPIDNAIKAMEDKNTELQVVIQEKSENRGASINPLTMALNGVIDAAVMGGTDMYREAFFVPEFVEQNPNKRAEISRLQKLISKQIEILEMGCLVHGSHCPANLKPMQKKLEDQLKEMTVKNEASAKEAFHPVVKKDAKPPSTPKGVAAEDKKKSPAAPTRAATNGASDSNSLQLPSGNSKLEKQVSTNPFDMFMEGAADPTTTATTSAAETTPAAPMADPTNPFDDPFQEPEPSPTTKNPIPPTKSLGSSLSAGDKPPPRPSFKSKPGSKSTSELPAAGSSVANPPPVPNRDSKLELASAPPLPTRTNIKTTLSIKVPRKAVTVAPPRPASKKPNTILKKPSMKNPFAVKGENHSLLLLRLSLYSCVYDPSNPSNAWKYVKHTFKELLGLVTGLGNCLWQPLSL